MELSAGALEPNRPPLGCIRPRGWAHAGRAAAAARIVQEFRADSGQPADGRPSPSPRPCAGCVEVNCRRRSLPPAPPTGLDLAGEGQDSASRQARSWSRSVRFAWGELQLLQAGIAECLHLWRYASAMLRRGDNARCDRPGGGRGLNAFYLGGPGAPHNPYLRCTHSAPLHQTFLNVVQGCAAALASRQAQQCACEGRGSRPSVAVCPAARHDALHTAAAVPLARLAK